jgi:hypothetical protein
MNYFKDLVDVTIDGEKCSNIVICSGTERRMITTCAYLIGSYMILCTNSTLADVAFAFQPVAGRFDRFKDGTEPETAEELTIFDCWEALHCGKMQGWLDFTTDTPDVDRCIDMEEYIHYDSPANGKLHVVIPSRLIAFPCPSDLEADEDSGEAPPWVDIAGVRHFGPDYYADILGDFDVQLVVRCDATATYDDDAFASRGLAVERLGGDLELRPHRLLQEVDRFLTLARLAPGMMGIHGADAGLGSGGELLVSSLLIKQHGFRARSALAWLRLTHPAADAQRALRFSVLPRRPPAAAPAAAPGALHLRSAADLRCLPSEPPPPAALRRSSSAPAALDEAAAGWAWDASAGGGAGVAWDTEVPPPAVFEALDGANLH